MFWSPERFLLDPQSLNAYSYARNNPIVYRDSSGQVVETVFDVLSLSLSTYDFYRNPSVWNGVFVALDGVGTAVPFVPAVFGYAKNGARVYKIYKYFDEIAIVSGRSIKEVSELFVKNIGFKFTRRAWTEGRAGNDMANFVGHFVKNGEAVGAVDVVDYYNKANDFIDTKSYTHSFQEGADTVFFNKNNKFTAVTDAKGNIKTYRIENNPNKINNYEQRIKIGNYGD